MTKCEKMMPDRQTARHVKILRSPRIAQITRINAIVNYKSLYPTDHRIAVVMLFVTHCNTEVSDI